ncbi:hypothetical protein ACFLQU_02115 [Verrucomicrobiota bacterium]
MAIGEDIHVDGTVSEKLLYSLQGPFQKLLRHVIPSLRQIRIHPGHVCSTPGSRAQGVATGFSGGIDSYCVLADHYYSDISTGFKITHLLFNNVGSHGPDGQQLFLQRYQRLLPVTKLLALPFVIVDSNLDSFYGPQLGFQQTHTARNASVALLLQKGIGRFMYASTFRYSDVFVGPTYDMAYCDTVALPLLSTEILDAFSVSSEYSRVEKTLRVAQFPDSYGTLDICVKTHNTTGYTNCSTCWKCLRTLLTLEIAGYLDRYGASFDLEAYRTRRDEYCASLLHSHDPLLQEIAQFAKDRNYSFPIWSLLIHKFSIFPVASLAKRLILKMKRLTQRFI